MLWCSHTKDLESKKAGFVEDNRRFFGLWPRMRSTPAGIRTPNLLIRSQMLYPIELRARCCLLPLLRCAKYTFFWSECQQKSQFFLEKAQKKWILGKISAEAVFEIGIIELADGVPGAVCMQEGDGGVWHAVEMGCFDDGVVSHVI